MQIMTKSSQTPHRTPSSQPTYLIKLHISQHQQVELSLHSGSDIDSVIQDCIDRYSLKIEAHGFLKKKILAFMGTVQKCRTDYSGDGLFGDSFGVGFKNPLRKKQNALKELKIGNIDPNKVSIQKTPKNVENFFFRKENSLRSPNNVTNHAKISLKKKAQSQKQNITTILTKNSDLLKQQCQKRALRRSEPVHKSAEKCKKQSVIIKSEEQIADENLQFLNDDELFSPVRQLRLKTTESQTENSIRMKQFSLQDLEKQMNEQVIDLKYEKKVRRLEPQICNLFRSIIRYNPPKVHKIDPRYACFQDLNEKIIKALHQFLLNLKDDELNSLDFDNMKKFLIKYRSDSLLDCLK